MLAAGLSDGNVAVYNLQKNPQKPSYISTARNGKHTDIVWQVKWVKDNLDGYLNFYSVSGDGRVTNWTIVKTALWFTDTLNIEFTKSLHNFSEEDAKTILKGTYNFKIIAIILTLLQLFQNYCNFISSQTVADVWHSIQMMIPCF